MAQVQVTQAVNRRRGRGVLLFGLPIAVILVMLARISQDVTDREDLNWNLTYAVRTGQVDEARDLLKQGADPNARDVLYVKPRNVWQRIRNCVKPLYHSNTHWSRTALSLATVTRRRGVLVKLLLDNGASVKEDDGGMQPAISCAVDAGDVSTVRLLIDHGADINVFDPLGRNALLSAIMENNPEMVRLLLDHGANPNVSTVTGMPAGSIRPTKEIAGMLNDAKTKLSAAATPASRR